MYRGRCHLPLACFCRAFFIAWTVLSGFSLLILSLSGFHSSSWIDIDGKCDLPSCFRWGYKYCLVRLHLTLARSLYRLTPNLCYSLTSPLHCFRLWLTIAIMCGTCHRGGPPQSSGWFFCFPCGKVVYPTYTKIDSVCFVVIVVAYFWRRFGDSFSWRRAPAALQHIESIMPTTEILTGSFFASAGLFFSPMRKVAVQRPDKAGDVFTWWQRDVLRLSLRQTLQKSVASMSVVTS